jgi:hypothetical protein
MMDLNLDNYEEWEIAQGITVRFLKNLLESQKRDWISEEEIKAYLLIISDNMWIKDFKKYAEENDLDKYCEEIYKEYDLD